MEMSALSDRETQVAVSEAKVQLQVLQLGKDGAQHSQRTSGKVRERRNDSDIDGWIVNVPLGCLIVLRPSPLVVMD